MNIISQFTDEYFFLSNYYPCFLNYKGIVYMSSEAAFHAQKDPRRAREFSTLVPAEAKRLGHKVNLRKDWERVKDDIMFDILKAKFTQNPALKDRLIDTGNAELEEGNTWHDTYWGVCNGIGINKLGQLLMKLREQLRKESYAK